MSATRWARIGYSLVAWLLAVAAVIQVYLAGSAITNLGGSGNFELHRNVGYGIGLLALILLVLAFAARMPLRVIAVTALLFGLMVLQSVLIFMRDGSPSITALHPVNGFLIVLSSWWLAWRTLAYIRAPLPPEPVRAPAPAPARVPPPPPQAAEPADEDRF